MNKYLYMHKYLYMNNYHNDFAIIFLAGVLEGHIARIFIV